MTENQNIEYKSTWRDEYLKWICGFANAHGGTIIIGKDDKGKVDGIDFVLPYGILQTGLNSGNFCFETADTGTQSVQSSQFGFECSDLSLNWSRTLSLFY